MTNKGDVIVNNQALDNETLVASEKKYSQEELDNRLDVIYNTGPSKVQQPPTNIKSIIALDENKDGTVKYTFDNIYEIKYFFYR